MNNDFPPIHRVSDPILRVSMNGQGRPVHKGGQIISRSPLDGDPYIALLNPIPDVTLTVDLVEEDFLFPGFNRPMDLIVEDPVMQAPG
jgi:hypothetical protein